MYHELFQCIPNYTLVTNPVIRLMSLISDFLPYLTYPLAFIYLCYYPSQMSFYYVFWLLVVSPLVNVLLKLGFKFAADFQARSDIKTLSPLNQLIYRPNSHKSVGMPSGHAQWIWFITALILLKPTWPPALQFPLTSWVVGSCLAVAGIVSVSRVLIGCHTVLQVVVGGMVGILLGWIAKSV